MGPATAADASTLPVGEWRPSRFRGGLELSDVEFLHRQHARDDALGRRGVRVVHEFGQSRGDDLPGESEPVAQPAAHRGLAPAREQSLPETVELGLIFDVDLDGHRLRVRELRPAALLCVDSLCTAEPERLGRTLQFSDTGLHPAQPDHSRHLDAARLGVPVLAAGIPTLMQAEEGRDLVVTPRDLDGVIAHGAALLGAAINRALQPKLSVAQLCWLVG